MAEAGFCSTGHRGDGQDVQVIPADGWAGFIATEISSRAGDPHLHVHCTLPNDFVGRDGLVRTMADGGRDLVINAPRFAAWGQAFVIEEAIKRGLIPSAWFDPETREWEVGAFSENSITAFSRGRTAVRAELRQAMDDRPRDARGLARRDRSAKARVTAAKADEQPTWGQLRATMLLRAQHGWLDLEAERAGVAPPVPQPGEWTDASGWSSRRPSCASTSRPPAWRASAPWSISPPADCRTRSGCGSPGSSSNRASSADTSPMTPACAPAGSSGSRAPPWAPRSGCWPCSTTALARTR